MSVTLINPYRFKPPAAPGFFTNGTAYFTDKTATTLAGNNGQWVARFRVKLASSTSGYFFQFSGTQGSAQLRPGSSILLSMNDAAGAVRMGSVVTIDNIVQTGVWHELVFCADLVANTFKIWVDGVLLFNYTMNAQVSTTFQTSRDIFLLATVAGASPVTGDIEIVQFFKNQITTDGTTSGLTPYKTIQGSAAEVMADPWFQGGIAT